MGLDKSDFETHREAPCVALALPCGADGSYCLAEHDVTTEVSR